MDQRRQGRLRLHRHPTGCKAVPDADRARDDRQIMQLHELPTPALLIDADLLEHNLATMAAARPGASLRPHVKAHKCTALAAMQHARGHTSFTCATPREVLGMAAAGLGYDLLLANEVLHAPRLAALAAAQEQANITVAVDSPETIDAAAAAGLRSVVVDVNVGLPRCGCRPEEAGRIADLARGRGLEVRGVMGYEGHLMVVDDREEQREKVAVAMDKLLAAHALVGGDVVSAGGTGTTCTVIGSPRCRPAATPSWTPTTPASARHSNRRRSYSALSCRPRRASR